MASVAFDNATKPRKAPPALNLPMAQAAFIIVKAREYDVKEENSDPDECTNPADHGQTDFLTKRPMIRYVRSCWARFAA